MTSAGPAITSTNSGPAFPAYMADLVDRAASLLRCRWVVQGVQFHNSPCDGAACYVRSEWPTDQPAPLAVVRDARSDEVVCQSLPGQPCKIDPPAPVRHGEMSDLVDRAASALKGRWLAPLVDFTWWADGEETAYCARMDWPHGLLAPRVEVFHAKSGDFVCQSLEGQPFEIDPHTWCIDALPDEIARHLWQQAQHRR